MTEEERKELEALKAKSDLTDEEKTRLQTLEAKAAATKDEPKMFSEDYVKTLRDEAAARRTALREAETRLAALDGVDADEYRKLKAQQEELEKTNLEKKGEFETLRQKLVDQHQVELKKAAEASAALEAEKQRLEGELKRTLMAHEVSVAASVAKAINPRLVEMVALDKMQVTESEDGRRLVQVVDEKGDPRVDLKTGKPLTVQQLMEELRTTDEYAHLFEGGTNGAGSRTINGKKSPANPWLKEHRNLTQQGVLFKEDPELAKRLMAEAAAQNSTA